MHLLEEGGLAAFNTNAIAARAGVSIGSLYQYFPGKEAIMAALILRWHERIALGQRQVLEQTAGMSMEKALRTLLQMLAEAHARDGKAGRIIDIEEERLPRTAQLEAVEDEIHELNRSFFRRYVRPERCGDRELDDAATETICIVRSMLEASRQGRSSGDANLVERMQRTVEGYLKPLL